MTGNLGPPVGEGLTELTQYEAPYRGGPPLSGSVGSAAGSDAFESQGREPNAGPVPADPIAGLERGDREGRHCVAVDRSFDVDEEMWQPAQDVSRVLEFRRVIGGPAPAQSPQGLVVLHGQQPLEFPDILVRGRLGPDRSVPVRRKLDVVVDRP